MSKDFRNELAEMERLMNYGMNESKKSTDSKAIVEYQQLAADGKTYGILREGTKYYVEVAPKKNTKVLTEDFDYLGGYMNRKAYDSYTKASNALNLQLISVNEANNSKKNVSQYNLNESAEWQTNMTKEARKELNRFYQLNGEIDNLLNENIHYIKESGDSKKAPFTEDGKANYNGNNGGGDTGKNGQQQNLGIKDKKFTDGQKSIDANAVYNKNGVKGQGLTKYEAAKGIDLKNAAPFSEKPTKIKEGRKSVKLSEEQQKQIANWRRGFVHNDEEGLVDRSHGTSIGDTAPWTNTVNEEEDWGSEGLPSTAGTGDAKKYREPFTNQNGVRQPVSEQYIFEVEMSEDDDVLSDIPEDESNIPDSEIAPDDPIRQIDPNGDPVDGRKSWKDEILGPGWDSIDSEPSVTDPDYFKNLDDDYANCSEGKQYVFEVTLDDFGKHPAYRKVPMTTPQNADSSKWGRDWNDESTKGEQPYGRQIGHSGDPFTDKVNAITNAVVTALGKKKD